AGSCQPPRQLPCSCSEVLAALLRVAHADRALHAVLRLLLDAVADTRRLLGRGVDEGDVGDVDGRFHRLDAARLGAALRLTDTGVLRDVIDAFDDDTVLLDEDVEDLALLAAVAAALGLGARDDLNQV